MINHLNLSTFTGYLGADAKQTTSNAPVTFSIAVSSHWTDNAGDRQTRTDWQNIVVFRNLDFGNLAWPTSAVCSGPPSGTLMLRVLGSAGA